MSGELVTIKGTRHGLIIRLHGQKDFEELKKALRAKFEGARGFFQGAKFILSPACYLTEDQTAELERICQDYGMQPATGARHLPGRDSELPTYLRELTLRSGQELSVEGHLVLLGHVHRGAIVRAAGSIFVLGQLKGIAHAGYLGDTNSVILALRMEPSQLRIAQAIAVPPVSEDNEPYPEIARLYSGRIVVEPYRQNLYTDLKGWKHVDEEVGGRAIKFTPKPHPQYVP